jgi:hypothetical protein
MARAAGASVLGKNVGAQAAPGLGGVAGAAGRAGRWPAWREHHGPRRAGTADTMRR